MNLSLELPSRCDDIFVMQSDFPRFFGFYPENDRRKYEVKMDILSIIRRGHHIQFVRFEEVVRFDPGPNHIS